MHFKLKNIIWYLLIAALTTLILFGVSEAADPNGERLLH